MYVPFAIISRISARSSSVMPGSTAGGESTIDVLRRAPQSKLVCLFAPENGLESTTRSATKFDDAIHATGLPIYSLYGKNKRPTKEQLKALDAVVIDLQDIGSRSYTYISWMRYTMEACFENGVEVIVLDRPNPLGGLKVGQRLVIGAHADVDLLAKLMGREGRAAGDELIDQPVLGGAARQALGHRPNGVLDGGVVAAAERVADPAVRIFGAKLVERVHGALAGVHHPSEAARTDQVGRRQPDLVGGDLDDGGRDAHRSPNRCELRVRIVRSRCWVVAGWCAFDEPHSPQ